MESILEKAKQDLLKPSKNTLRYLVIVLNIVYLISATFFLTSERIAEGKFVPVPELFYIAFLPAILSNFISLAYNLVGVKVKNDTIAKNKLIKRVYLEKDNKYFKVSSWISIISVMFMSFVHMNGLGNPSNDAILTDFALGHSLIIVAVILLGRKGATVWGIIVLITLLINVSKMGWDFQFHYLTTEESHTYEIALEKNEEWAIRRHDKLKSEGLNPPKISRYFNTWLIFIVVAYFAAYFYSGITTDILKILPSVVNKIERGIQENFKVKSTLELQQKELAFTSFQIHRNSEMLDRILIEFDKLDYREKEKFRPIINLIKQELTMQNGWEKLKINFNSLHNGFFEYLESNFPELSNIDKKHLAYIRMNLDNTSIAQLMNVKLDSLRKHRYRIKVKLGLDNDDGLYNYLKKISVKKQ